MKIRVFPFQNDIMLSETYITILNVNNKKLFNRLANTFYTYSIGEEGEEQVLLIEEDKTLDFDEEILFLSDLWHFDCGNKKIVAKLFNYIEQNYKSDVELMEVFQQQLQRIQVEISDITDELPFEIEMKEVVTLLDILKMLGVKVAKLDGLSLIERAISIVEIVSTFKLYPCIMMCNIKDYLEKNELIELYKATMHCKIKLIIYEYGPVYERLADEKIWYIDEDYEEFTY